MKRMTILVSMDGIPENCFRKVWEQRHSDICIQRLQTVYPSITVPVHVSVLNGKKPEEHGITENIVIENPGYHKTPLYYPSEEEAIRVMPKDTIIHELIQKGLSCGTINWPLGQGLPGENRSAALATHEEAESADNACKKDLRIKQLLEEEMRQKKKDFLAIHFEEYDSNAHIYGVDSKQAQTACEHMALYVEEIIALAEQYGIENLIFFSDHGMIEKKENFFPNIYIKKHGYEREMKEKQIYFLSDGSGCMSFYSCLSEKENKEIARKMICSEKIQKVTWYDGKCTNFVKPCAVFELKKGICSEDIMQESEEKYADMKGLHGYDPEHVPQMNGFILIYDPKKKLAISKDKLEVTDIYHMIKIFVNSGGNEYGSEHKIGSI